MRYAPHLGLGPECHSCHANFGVFLRRLYSTFARGGPGVGLLLLRLVAGIVVMADGAELMHSGAVLPNLLGIAPALLLLVGLWTPVSGSLLAALGVWNALSRTTGLRVDVLLSAIEAALALLGPGVWSIDARVFGWRRIDLSDRGQ